MSLFVSRLYLLAFAALVVTSIVVLATIHTIDQSLEDNTGDYVVLLHGLGRSPMAMSAMGLRLADEGYRVLNFGYPSREQPIPELVDEHLWPAIESFELEDGDQIHFVTHSMGGIMVRQLLAERSLAQMGRVVMLAPPNNGSDLADRVAESSVLSFLMGPSLTQMQTTQSLVLELPSPWYEVGIIAGLYDEKVDVEYTKLPTMTDFLIVENEHTWIMFDRDVIDATVRFIESGSF